VPEKRRIFGPLKMKGSSGEYGRTGPRPSFRNLRPPSLLIAQPMPDQPDRTQFLSVLSTVSEPMFQKTMHSLLPGRLPRTGVRRATRPATISNYSSRLDRKKWRSGLVRRPDLGISPENIPDSAGLARVRPALMLLSHLVSSNGHRANFVQLRDISPARVS